MNDPQKKPENADIRKLRSRRADLQQAQSQGHADIQAGDVTEQHERQLQQQWLNAQIQAVDDQIDEMNALLENGPTSPDDVIAVGHVVTIRIDDGDPQTYVLVNESGGHELSGKTTLSSGTPVGSALIGQRVGASIAVEVGDAQLTIEIVACESLA